MPDDMQQADRLATLADLINRCGGGGWLDRSFVTTVAVCSLESGYESRVRSSRAVGSCSRVAIRMIPCGGMS